MKLETQIVTGECPECNTLTMLVVLILIFTDV